MTTLEEAKYILTELVATDRIDSSIAELITEMLERLDSHRQRINTLEQYSQIHAYQIEKLEKQGGMH